LRALEAYTSDLQRKYDRLVHGDVEKTQALNELLENDLTKKLVEYKSQVEELREILKVKEKEREVYINHLNLSSTDPMYGAKLLEQ
jgi:intergrase/recombinase